MAKKKGKGRGWHDDSVGHAAAARKSSKRRKKGGFKIKMNPKANWSAHLGGGLHKG